jgi:hypothetical protein
MKRIYLLILIVGLLLMGSVRLTPTAHAQPQATYELVQSYTGPGGSGSAGIYDISSSIGQPAAGEVSAGSYTLGGGFWGGGVLVPVANKYDLFLPLLLK